MTDFVDKAIAKKLGKKPPTSHNISFSFIPGVNAVTRSNDKEAKEILFKAFVGEETVEAGLKVTNASHKQQKALVASLLEPLLAQVDENHKCVVVYIDPKDASYSGLLANMLVSRYNKPAIVLREQNSTNWSGSVRSPVPTLEAINSTHLANAQGHPCSHGILLPKGNLDRLIEWFDNQSLADTTVYDVTASIKPQDVTVDLCQQIADNAILWGKDAPEPLFHTSFLSVPTERVVYRKASNTVKFNVNGVSFLVFRANEDLAKQVESDETFNVELLFVPDINEYEGTLYPQGIVSNVETYPYIKTNTNWEEIF